MLKILFIPNWNVHRLIDDDPGIQAPDKVVQGQPYWFFRHFAEQPLVDIIDRGTATWFRKLEEGAKFYVRQPLKAWHRMDDYDLVISHGAQSGLVFELANSLSRHRTPHLMIDVGCLNGGRINHTETPLIRYALRQCPTLVTHSSRQLDFYRQHYPALADKARFIPFGVDIDHFTPQPMAPTRTVVAFGHRKRDHATLCEAFPQGMGWQLQIIGDTALARQYASSDIQFFDAMPLAQLVQHIAHSELVVVALPELPYSYGQMTLLQSMALGRPVVCTLTTSTIDYVSHARCVATVPPADVDAMRAALLQMIGLSHQQRVAQGAACRQWVERHYSEQLMAQQFESLIQQVPLTS